MKLKRDFAAKWGVKIDDAKKNQTQKALYLLFYWLISLFNASHFERDLSAGKNSKLLASLSDNEI